MAERSPEGEFELASTRRALEATEQLMHGWRRETHRREAELVVAEAKLAEAELRAERAEGALVSIRSGRAYKLMRIVWRVHSALGLR